MPSTIGSQVLGFYLIRFIDFLIDCIFFSGSCVLGGSITSSDNSSTSNGRLRLNSSALDDENVPQFHAPDSLERN